jgi:hypothetical protein
MTSSDNTPDRDYDHRAENAVLAYIANPTEHNAHAAELAVAKLQRAHDHLLRRLDGDGELPAFPVHSHSAEEHPEDCAEATLFELAGAKLDDRAETLAHGQKAVHTLARQLDAARAAADQTHHWHDRYHDLHRRHEDEVDQLRRALSEARSWAWAQAHRHWVYYWFPHAWPRGIRRTSGTSRTGSSRSASPTSRTGGPHPDRSSTPTSTPSPASTPELSAFPSASRSSLPSRSTSPTGATTSALT